MWLVINQLHGYHEHTSTLMHIIETIRIMSFFYLTLKGPPAPPPPAYALAPMHLMHQCTWCTNAPDTPMHHADAPDVLMHLMYRCTWCTYAPDAPACIWCTDALNALMHAPDIHLMHLMHLCTWCTDALNAPNVLMHAPDALNALMHVPDAPDHRYFRCTWCTDACTWCTWCTVMQYINQCFLGFQPPTHNFKLLRLCSWDENHIRCANCQLNASMESFLIIRMQSAKRWCRLWKF